MYMLQCFFPAWPAFWRQAALFVVCAAALGVLALILGELLPRRWFRHDNPFFRSRPWEDGGRLYDRLFRVKKWKDKLPDNSRIFPWVYKKKVLDFHDPAQSLRLLQETCVAEAVHWALIALSPLFFWVLEPTYALVWGLIYVALGNLPFIVIQRYNRPRLARIYERQLKYQAGGAR